MLNMNLVSNLLEFLQVGGWPDEVISVTDQPFNEHTYVPRQVTLGDLIKLKHAWNAAVLRALAAGVDVSYLSSEEVCQMTVRCTMKAR